MTQLEDLIKEHVGYTEEVMPPPPKCEECNFCILAASANWTPVCTLPETIGLPHFSVKVSGRCRNFKPKEPTK